MTKIVLIPKSTYSKNAYCEGLKSNIIIKFSMNPLNVYGGECRFTPKLKRLNLWRKS